MLTAIGANSANELLHWFYTRDYPRDRIAAFAPLVDQVAAEGDAVARSVLQGAAQQLAALVSSVRAQLFAPGTPVYVATIGGVFTSQAVAGWFRTLVELEPGSTVGPPRHEPAYGALLTAMGTADERR